MTTETLPATYRAVVFESCSNGIEAMKLRSDVTHPTLKPTHLRIRVHSAAVNPADYKVIECGSSGPQPTVENPYRSGFDVSGTVAEVGPEVARFQVGDEVYGMTYFRHLGLFAEYMESDECYIAHKPKNMIFRDASGVPLAGLTSYQALTKYGKLKTGDRVLIIGGISGSGVYRIQIAKALRAAIIATTTSARNSAFVKGLGADQVIDYTSEDWSEVLEPHSIDLIYDCGFEWYS